MRHLRWAGLVFSLSIVGVLGGLMAPVSSEALNTVQPTVTIDTIGVIMTRIPNVNNACPPPDTAYNSCWKINPGTYGGWTVGNVSSGNTARVLINDASAAGSVDSMKMTGITFKPIAPVAAVPGKTVHAIVTHIFNEGGGNISGDYQWAMAQGGQFDPLFNENVVGDRLTLTGTGTASGVNFPLGVLDTGAFTTSTINDIVGYVARSKTASVVKPACNTGSNRCAPTIKYDYAITVVGSDTLFLTDSVWGSGGPCYKGLKLALLKLIDHIFDKFDALQDDEHPLGCKKFAEALDVQKDITVAEIITEGQNTPGAVLAETCLGACIVINKTTDPVTNTIFDFTGTGAGINSFHLSTDDQICEEGCINTGTGTTTFSGLAAGTSGWVIEETGFPFVPDTFDPIPPGQEGNDHDALWWTRNVSCVSTLNPGGGSLESGTSWTTHVPNFDDVNAARHELGDNPPTGDLTLRQGKVTVTKLAPNDTLTCTFENEVLHD